MTNPEPTAERPGFPRGYGISQYQAGLMSWPDIEEKLKQSRNYWVSSTRVDGRPHAAPVWGLWLDGALLFSSDPTSIKARNLYSKPDVVIHLESGDDVVILEGTIDTFNESDPVFGSFVKAYDAKYGIRIEPNPDFAYFRLQPATAMAWLESDYPNTAPRWHFAPDTSR